MVSKCGRESHDKIKYKKNQESSNDEIEPSDGIFSDKEYAREDELNIHLGKNLVHIEGYVFKHVNFVLPYKNHTV